MLAVVLPLPRLKSAQLGGSTLASPLCFVHCLLFLLVPRDSVVIKGKKIQVKQKLVL